MQHIPKTLFLDVLQFLEALEVEKCQLISRSWYQNIESSMGIVPRWYFPVVKYEELRSYNYWRYKSWKTSEYVPIKLDSGFMFPKRNFLVGELRFIIYIRIGWKCHSGAVRLDSWFFVPMECLKGVSANLRRSKKSLYLHQ